MFRGLAIFLALALILSGCGGATQQTQTKDGVSLTLATDPAPPVVGRHTTLQFELQRGATAVSEADVSFTRGMPGMEHPDDRTDGERERDD